jgi:hypothetical protein
MPNYELFLSSIENESAGERWKGSNLKLIIGRERQLVDVERY